MMDKLVETGIPLRKAIAMGMYEGMYGKGKGGSKKAKPGKRKSGKRKMPRRRKSGGY